MSTVKRTFGTPRERRKDVRKVSEEALGFGSKEDIVRYFDENPDRLTDYVEMGIERDTTIIGFHIGQLAMKVGHPLKYGTKSYRTLPWDAIVRPDQFNNIRSIIDMARLKFPPLGKAARGSSTLQ